jgi:thiamine biosynthesis lipoprotein
MSLLKFNKLYFYLSALIVLLLLFIYSIRLRPAEEKIYPVMGTWIKVKAPHAEVAVNEILRLEHLFSRFDPSSEVCVINRSAGKHPVKVSEDTFNIIKQSLLVSQQSLGAFDITLGRHGNYQDIVLDKEKQTVSLKNAGMQIDLGGIGKGYALEAARSLLLRAGVKKALLDMRSSIAVIGGPWKIGIVDPRAANVERRTSSVGEKEGNLLGTIILNNGESLSTSGQYEQPGHIIDPRTGRRADACLSVTIVTSDAGLADALSTAVFVLGPQKGMELSKALNCKALIVTKSGKIAGDLKIL